MYEIYAKIRDKHGFTDYKVAKEIGITTAAISSWKAKRTELKFKYLVRIADLFGVSVDVFSPAVRKEE